MQALDADAGIGCGCGHWELTDIQKQIRAQGIVIAVWSSDFDAGIDIDFDASIEVDFDASIEINFDAGIEVHFDVGINVDFDVGIGSSPELTDAENRSEQTGSFLIQDVPGHPETDPSTRDCYCFKMFHVACNF